MEAGKKPLTLIQKYLNRNIRVMLKNDLVYEGIVVECDNYMNLVIDKAVEYQDNNKKAMYPRILIRGNNIMYIQLSPEST
ncbi:MAG: LSM domain-containing protein [Nitrososphaerota archaeon]|nr:LSM domain-containing protein [Candidatus Geocrenenecus dongiae]